VRARLGAFTLPFCSITHKNAVVGSQRPFPFGLYREGFVDFYLRAVLM
jgi:hypothetical protein